MPARKFIRLPITRKLLTYIFSQIKVSTERRYRGIPCWELPYDHPTRVRIRERDRARTR